jgi:hypothetical protein
MGTVWVSEPHPLGGTIEMARVERLVAAAPAGKQAASELPLAAVLPREESAGLDQLAAAGAGSDPDMEWRRLSGNSNRLLPIAAWARQVEVCYWLWKTNPLGNWIIETQTALITGNGYSAMSKNENLQKFIRSFWHDPINNFDVKLEDKVRQLSIFGLQVWTVFKGEQTGRVRLGMVDPAQVRNVYSDPQNAELQIGVQISNFHTGEPRYLKTIIGKEAETVLSPDGLQMRESYQDGECFLFSINRVSNDPFGTSDIFVIADWLDEYEEFLYAYVGKAKKQNAHIWDVTIEGGSEEDCDKFAKKYPTQSDGSVRVHNQLVKWQALAPELKALEQSSALREFRNHILGSRNIPEHWYGGAGSVNRATAGESNEPILAFIGKRQQMVKQMLTTMINYAIDCAVEAGYPLGVPEEELYSYEIQVPEATNKDVTKVAAAVQQLVAAMAVAASNSWLDRDNAVKMFAFIMEMIGFAIDQEAILEAEPGGEDYPDKGPAGPKTPVPGKAKEPAAEGKDS